MVNKKLPRTPSYWSRRETFYSRPEGRPVKLLMTPPAEATAQITPREKRDTTMSDQKYPVRTTPSPKTYNPELHGSYREPAGPPGSAELYEELQELRKHHVEAVHQFSVYKRVTDRCLFIFFLGFVLHVVGTAFGG